MSKQHVIHKQRFCWKCVNITRTEIETTLHESKSAVKNRMHTEKFEIIQATIPVASCRDLLSHHTERNRLYHVDLRFCLESGKLPEMSFRFSGLSEKKNLLD